MVFLYYPFAVPEYILFLLHHRVGRQSPVLLRKAHAAAGGVESHARKLRPFYLCIQQVRVSLGEKIMMIGGRGDPALHHFHYCRHRGGPDGLLVDVLPLFIEEGQPVEQLGALYLLYGSGKRLVKMMVRVYKTGKYHHSLCGDHPVGLLHFGRAASHAFDHVVLDIYPAALYFLHVLIKSGDNVRILDQCLHFIPPSLRFKSSYILSDVAGIL